MEKKVKELRLNVGFAEARADEAEPEKMIVEGYPIVFDAETWIGFDESDPYGWYEKVDRKAFDNADMTDVCLKYNHNDDFLILARTRNGSLKLTPDEHGVFMHAELIDTQQNRDIYAMVKSELLKEGSFAFTVTNENIGESEGKTHRTITEIGKLFDVAICPNGAYGDMTEIYARSRDLVDTKRATLENVKRVELMRLRNKNKIKMMR